MDSTETRHNSDTALSMENRHKSKLQVSVPAALCSIQATMEAIVLSNMRELAGDDVTGGSCTPEYGCCLRRQQ